MIKIGFITPNYQAERRIALLPKDVTSNIQYVVEEGFGKNLDISDDLYIKNGCEISTREKIFKECNYIFSLKLLQKSDYQYLRPEQTIIGWTHPNGSGKNFMEEQAFPLKLTIVDLDNIYPSIYKDKITKKIDWIPSNFLRKNSYYAGFAAVQHALLSYGFIPDNTTKVAILSPGNVSQGAMAALCSYNADIQMFYRTTMSQFQNCIDQFDIIVNGIELQKNDSHIINKNLLRKTKKNVLIIDAAADAGYAIEGIDFTTHLKPLSTIENRTYYCINNAPTFYHKTVSKYLSQALKEHFFDLVTEKKLSISQ